jgi:hypothetical protein
VGSNRTWSGREGLPPWVRCVQFFASEAVGVGSSRGRPSGTGSCCLSPLPAEQFSGVVDVDGAAAWAVVAGPGEQEHAFAAVGGSDVGGADATPCRVIPRFGQVAGYTAESSPAPAKRGDVLQHEQRGS